MVLLSSAVGQLPAMGFNTWNAFRCDNVSSASVLGAADALIESGLARAGYRYVNVDDCWSSLALADDMEGSLVAADNFPEGMAYVGEELHRRDLLFGLYADRGFRTCAGRAGSRGREKRHAQQFAEWGVDYLKYDSCYAPNFFRKGAIKDYKRMRNALGKTGRDVLFSACGWNWWYAVVEPKLAHSARIAADCDEWANVYEASRTNEVLGAFARRGKFNDPDMLLGSSPRAAAYLSPQRSRAQFALWGIMTAPLLLGVNPYDLSQYDIETYTNEEIIAVNQDPVARQGVVVFSTCPDWKLKDYWWCSPWSMPADVRRDWTKMLLTLAAICLLSRSLIARRPRLRVRSVSFVLFSIFAGYAGVLQYYKPTLHACTQVWAKPLSEDRGVALLFVSWDGPSTNVTCDFDCLYHAGLSLGESYSVRDLQNHVDLDAPLDIFDKTYSSLSASLSADGDAKMFRVFQP